MPAQKKFTELFDETAEKVKEDLKKEIIKDLREAGNKVISVTSDHGTSSDLWRSKKNVVTVARTTKDFFIRKDIVKMIQCQGTQTGNQIKLDVLKALKDRAGYDDTWIVNWVGDGEAKQVNARN